LNGIRETASFKGLQKKSILSLLRFAAIGLTGPSLWERLGEKESVHGEFGSLFS
jgi:hypothetical protein